MTVTIVAKEKKILLLFAPAYKDSGKGENNCFSEKRINACNRQ